LLNQEISWYNVGKSILPFFTIEEPHEPVV
jgi:hypothetical protein